MYLPGYLIMIIKTHSTSLKLPFSIEKCKNFSREEKIRIKEENFMRDDLPGIINCVLLPPRRPWNNTFSASLLKLMRIVGRAVHASATEKVMVAERELDEKYGMARAGCSDTINCGINRALA